MCTRFEIIDDLIALEGEENFVIDVRPRQGLVQIGIKNRTVVTIEDNDGGLFFNGHYTVSTSHHNYELSYKCHC